MPAGRIRVSLVISAAAWLVFGAACATTVDQPWGSEAEPYFQELARAFTEDDSYGVLDFFSAEALVEYRTEDTRGVPQAVPELLAGNRADLGYDLLEVHLSSAGAVTLIHWPNSGDFGAVAAELHDGLITGETVFVDVTSLESSLQASPNVVRRYEVLYEEFAEAWSSGNPELLARLYAPDAELHEPFSGNAVRGADGIARLARDGLTQWTPVAPTRDASASVDTPALFFDPVRFGHDPQRAVGVFEVESRDGCSRRVAVRWELRAGLVVDEFRYGEVESFRRCADDLPDGWWTGLGLPPPRDQLVTGTLRTPTGQTISVHNGTPRLEELLEWGLGRFAIAGLAEPRVDSATFEPTRECEGVFGRVSNDKGSHDLVLCVYDSDLCQEPEACVPALNVRMGILHELSHAWMLDHVDNQTRNDLLALSGRSVWSDAEVAWTERGVEYAAEVLAWGLVDEPVRLIQLGDPPCDQLTGGFELLAGSGSLLNPAVCPSE